MIVNILVATIDSGIMKVDQVLLPPRENIRYVISHQVTAEQYRTIPETLKRSDVIVSQIEGRGLCRNRNNCLRYAEGDLAILADDDVRYLPENIEAVRQAYADDPELDVACFKITTPPGQPAYKDYYADDYLINDENHHYLSTIEITFRLGSIKENGIAFDERFGLGSPLNSFGEEAVFIHDCLKAGLKVKYIPAYLVEHEAASTIKSTGRFDSVNTIFKGAYDARRYGWLAYPAAFYDTVKLRAELSNERKRPAAYLTERLQGALYITRSGGKKNPFAW